MAHILIVEDDEVSRIFLGRILEDAGHEVAYAADGAYATLMKPVNGGALVDLVERSIKDVGSFWEQVWL